jgi:hypothetical protein
MSPVARLGGQIVDGCSGAEIRKRIDAEVAAFKTAEG